MIDTIVFDMGGVIIDFDPKKTLNELFDPETAEAVLNEIFLDDVWRERDRGTLTSEELLDMKRSVIPDKDYDKVAELISNFFPYMKQFDDIEPLIDKLKQNGYRLLLLSNASKDFHENKRLIPALKKLDGLFISSDYRLLKPEKEIYEKFFEVEGVDPENCFFIDDTSANIYGAESCGMKGHVYKHGHMDALLEAMRVAGINI